MRIPATEKGSWHIRRFCVCLKKKKKKRTVGDVIRTLILIVALGVFCYSGYQLFGIYTEYKKGDDEYDALEDEYVIAPDEKEVDIQEVEGEPVMKNPIDFDGLLSMNKDIIGWLKVEALDISYPMTQGEDNDYYLHNTFQDTPNIAGCIFLDYENKKDFSDRNSIIYGHNMRNGSMFGTLKKFREEGVFEKSPISGFTRRKRFTSMRFSPAMRWAIPVRRTSLPLRTTMILWHI